MRSIKHTIASFMRKNMEYPWIYGIGKNQYKDKYIVKIGSY